MNAPADQTAPELPPSSVSAIEPQLRSALAAARTAEECMGVAEAADQAGAGELLRSALEQAVALDRGCQPALLSLAAAYLESGDAATTYAFLEEAARLAPLAEDVDLLRQQLQIAAGEQLEGYLRAIGRIAAEHPAKTLSIVLVTNLFPPQELGGYGRMMWEFAQGLLARGHKVRVLTANAVEFGKAPTPDEAELEQHVLRTLELAGTWRNGRPVLVEDRNEVARRLRDNAARVRTAVARLDADLVIAGNLDFLGTSLLRSALDQEIPVLHALANASPGYSPSEQPTEPHYWVAPCSDWNGEAFRNAGYSPTRVDTLYPGARLDRFFRLILPDTRRLRICYASLVLPYKGVHVLVQALAALHAAGIDFTAEIAGDAPDAQFLAQLKETVSSAGMADKVRFTGFLDRQGLTALFARSNVLVFPSQFAEPFGISQVEAMASGLVVVTSATGGAREIVRDGIDGLHFSATQPASLAEKLSSLARDSELFARLQRAAQARATVFSVENAVLKIESLAAEMHAAIEAAHQPAISDIAL